MSNSRSKLSRIAALVVSVAMPLLWVHSAQAQSAADNIRPVAKVCLAGQPCVGSVAAGSNPASVSAPATPEPVEVAPAAVVATTAEVAAAETGFDAAAKYQQSCFACHGTGAADAPKLDDKAAWEERMAKGMDAVMENVVNGMGAMPAKGLCFDCSDSDLVALVEYMSSQ